MDWTDRHCRVFHRHITRHTWLYTEMVTTGALLYGECGRAISILMKSNTRWRCNLAAVSRLTWPKAPKLGQDWGYDEINLNCGCPSERVQKGAFGACLMAEPQLVADCVKAMRDAVTIDVTVKHRIGIDQTESYDFVRDFVGTVAESGCSTFIVHARNAILKGLSPKENREIPPLKYEFAYQLKRDFPDLEIIINGGIKHLAEIDAHLAAGRWRDAWARSVSQSVFDGAIRYALLWRGGTGAAARTDFGGDAAVYRTTIGRVCCPWPEAKQHIAPYARFGDRCAGGTGVSANAVGLKAVGRRPTGAVAADAWHACNERMLRAA